MAEMVDPPGRCGVVGRITVDTTLEFNLKTYEQAFTKEYRSLCMPVKQLATLNLLKYVEDPCVVVRR